MKKILFFAGCALTIASNSSAQSFSNASFETWQNFNVSTSIIPPTSIALEKPDAWFGMDSLIAAISPLAGLGGLPITPAKQTTKVTDAHSGTYAVQVETKFLGDSLGNVPGLLLNARVAFDLAAIIGDPDLSNFLSLVTYSNGTPTLGRKVDTVSAWLKLTSQNTDDASIIIMAMQKQTINGVDSMVEIGSGSMLIDPTLDNYTEVSVPIEYDNATVTATDTLIVVFSSSALFSGSAEPTAGNKLLIDDVAMVTSPSNDTSGTSVKQPLMADTKILVYPNPAKDKVYFNLNTRENAQDYILSIVDVQGRVVFTENLQQPINEKQVDNWVKGTYFYSLTNKKTQHRTGGSFVVE